MPAHPFTFLLLGTVNGFPSISLSTRFKFFFFFYHFGWKFSPKVIYLSVIFFFSNMSYYS